MKNILVLCTGNSCRSQIAHGFLASMTAGKAHVYSAGLETHGVNPRAIATMKEIGIDISHHTSNNITEYFGIDFDYVITVESSDLSRRERLLQRGLKSYEIDARIAAQASNEQRASISDFVLRNDSSQNELLRAVEHLWEDVFPPLQRASD